MEVGGEGEREKPTFRKEGTSVSAVLWERYLSSSVRNLRPSDRASLQPA